MPTLVGARARRFTVAPSPAPLPAPRRSRPTPGSPPAPAPRRRRAPDRRPEGTPHWAVWFARRRGGGAEVFVGQRRLVHVDVPVPVQRHDQSRLGLEWTRFGARQAG